MRELKQSLKSVPVDNAVSANRLLWVDYVRGFVIILVVYRHVVVGLKRSGFEITSLMYNLQELVYNFRMPIFFILSGVFLTLSLKKRTARTIAISKVSNLLYPYLIWGAITIILQICFASFANSQRTWKDLTTLITDPRGVDHLWYLLALFNTTILYLFFSKVVKVQWINFLIAVVLYQISRAAFMDGNSLFADMFYYYIYFYLGAVFSKFIANISYERRVFQSKYLYFILPVVLIGQAFWFHFWVSVDYKIIERNYLFLFLIINLLACYFVFLVAYLAAKKFNLRLLKLLGKYSLYIYVLHVFVASAFRTLVKATGLELNIWLLVSISCVVSLAVPIILVKLLRPIGFEHLFSIKLQRNVISQ